MNLKNYSKKQGYRPDLSDGIGDKYEDVLRKYLKEERYNEFCELREFITNEEEIFQFIGDDKKLLKLVMSGQLQISISILEKMIVHLRERALTPNQVLDLGESDGWALEFLFDYFNWDCPLTLVDKNSIWTPVNDTINCIQSAYADFTSDSKYDLIISILGAPSNNLEEIFDCVKQSISD